MSRSLADELARLAREADPDGTGTDELSRREREVLQLLAQGQSMKEVAAALAINARTVEFHQYPHHAPAGRPDQRRARPAGVPAGPDHFVTAAALRPGVNRRSNP